jgi:hypothetical protein
MLALILLLMIAFHGGIFSWLIISSAIKSSKTNVSLSIIEELWSMPWH